MDKATMEKDPRYVHSIQMMDHTIEKIRTNRHLVESDSDHMARLWFAMNQKFYKKILWWEDRWHNLWHHVYLLEEKLAERSRMIRERDETIKQLEALLGVQHEIEKREDSGQQ